MVTADVEMEHEEQQAAAKHAAATKATAQADQQLFAKIDSLEQELKAEGQYFDGDYFHEF